MDKQPLTVAEIDWGRIERVLIVKLRSIGDTVLSTPSLIALKRHAPHVEADILLEDWVAPVLDGFEHVDRVITVGSSTGDRLRTARALRKRRYDVVFNLHGGTTATFFTAATWASHRFGIADYQYSFIYNHRLTSAGDFWGREPTHSAEQQLALLGHAGVPVRDRPKTHLAVTAQAAEAVDKKFRSAIGGEPFALMHPASLFATKQWAVANFARTAEFLAEMGLSTVAVASPSERRVLDDLDREARVPVTIFDNLTLPEITAAAARATIFVGNDSGIAHMAAAVKTPVVVIFGSSNRIHWGPWTDSPSEIVFREFHCQPCPGYICEEFGEPRCILTVDTGSVFEAIERILEKPRGS